MKIAIPVAHALEYTTFKRRMGKTQGRPLGSRQHYLWQYNGSKVILVETGMGPQEAAGAMSKLIKSYGVDCIINFGSAATINENLQIGDPFLTDKITDFASGNIIKSNPQINRAVRQYLEGRSKAYIRGPLLTSPEPVMGSRERRELADQFSCWAVDTEAYALAKIAEENNIPFTAIKIICDRVSAQTRLEYWKNLTRLEKKLGELVYGLIEFFRAA